VRKHHIVNYNQNTYKQLMAKKSTPVNYIEVLRKLARAGMQGAQYVNRRGVNVSDMPTLEERVEKLLGVVNKENREVGNMLFFVMYDIESDKVRYNVVKYLERMGCTRVQKSIFLADLSTEKYQSIRNDLTEVQALYDNHDSIIICPVSTDLLRNMKIIGKSIDVDVITKSKNTLFF